MGRTTRLLAALALGLLLAVGCTSPADDAEQRLLAADRAFLQATIDGGLDGWMSFFTEDATRVDLQGGTAVGLEEIRQADAPLFEAGGLRLRWEPETAVAFAGGREGLTRGRYTLIRPQEDGEPEVAGRGAYLTLWRLEDGRFKVYLDTGAPDPPEGKLID
jgi:ketosteroid isomerase-like protein